MTVVGIAGLTLGFIAVIGGLGVSALAIVTGIRHDWRKRELEHRERMKALELGRTLPQDEPWLSPAKIGAMIGVGVPIVAFTGAGSATSAAGFHEGIWIAAGMVGTASVLAGSILVAQSHRRREAAGPLDSAKPYLEEDAYDVVSSRG